MRGCLPKKLFALAGSILTFAGNAAPLAEKSPFLRSDGNASPGIAKDVAALELRGIMSDAGGNRYYIYDAAKKHGVWAAPNETDNSFVILSDNAGGGFLEVRTHEGRLLRLTLREAKVREDWPEAGSPSVAVQGDSEVAPLEAVAIKSEAEKKWAKFQEEQIRRSADKARAMRAAAGQTGPQ